MQRQKQKQVAKWKIDEVEKLKQMISEYPVVGIVNMENIPARQLQKMREVLRGDVVIRMSRKRLMKLALGKADVAKLSEYLNGQPAFIFSKINPFKLYKILEKSKTPAPAKPNAIAPKDIVVPKGETPFSPGPLLAELQKFGIKTAIQKNKIVIKQDKLVVKEGERISPDLAGLLTRLEIEPMEVGLDLLAAYEGGVVYSPDVLAIDENELMAQLQEAYRNAVNVSLNTIYITKETAPLLIAKACSEAKAVAIEAGIYERDVVDDIIAKAHLQMLALKSTIQQASLASEGKDILFQKTGGEEMEYIYAAMLLHSAGKEINEKNVTSVLKASGVKADKARVKALVAALDGVDIEEAIKQAVAAPVATAAPAAAPAAVTEEAPAEEAKEEEEKEEGESEEEALAGLGALFG